MKAVLIAENKDLILSEVPDPVIKDDEVLVKVRAAGLNRADLLQREGKYPSPPGCPDWMGLEISGEIVTVGKTAKERSLWKPGDRVCALLGGGGYAEYAAVKYDMLLPVPKGLSFVEAAALPEAYATSYLNLFIEGHLQAGQTLFIPAGSSGLASVAIPMAKAFGARVISTVRKEKDVETVRRAGADLVINSVTENVGEILAEEEKNFRPINVAMDCVGGDMLSQSFGYMARGGYWILIATLAGTTAEIPLRPLLSKGLHLVGSTLRSRAPEYKAFILSELRKNLWPKIESGEIKPVIYRTFPLSRAEDAHAVLARNENVGKVVLTVD